MHWELALTPEQDTIFKNDHFNPTWSKYATDDRINLELAQDFMDNLLQPSAEAQAEMDSSAADTDNSNYLL